MIESRVEVDKSRERVPRARALKPQRRPAKKSEGGQKLVENPGATGRKRGLYLHLSPATGCKTPGLLPSGG